MKKGTLAREKLWEIAALQQGHVAATQAAEAGVSKQALQMLLQRGTLERVVRGVYRFPQYPPSEYDPFAVAVLWARVPEAALSHETALAAYGISDVNPHLIHVTVAKNRRFRRTDGQDYQIHREDLEPDQIGWWQEIPTVTPFVAVRQCIEFGTPTYLIRQALDRGRIQGHLAKGECEYLKSLLEARNA